MELGPPQNFVLKYLNVLPENPAPLRTASVGAARSNKLSSKAIRHVSLVS
jgi:hypothetical protein